jgi:hypothetical protein
VLPAKVGIVILVTGKSGDASDISGKGHSSCADVQRATVCGNATRSQRHNRIQVQTRSAVRFFDKCLVVPPLTTSGGAKPTVSLISRPIFSAFCRAFWAQRIKPYSFTNRLIDGAVLLSRRFASSSRGRVKSIGCSHLPKRAGENCYRGRPG